ncbi:MAG: HAMP domain-containing histidine kinase [Actinobacteria bacterium]|nr:HAMP domain-containing histidine kinase [Actinomycetota bacterium]
MTASGTEPAARRRLNPVVLLTLAMLAVSAVLLAYLWGTPVPSSAPIRLPWFVFAVGAFLVERYTVNLHFRGDNHTLTLGELPLILGLYFAAPVEFVLGRLLGILLLSVLDGHQTKPAKIAFNTGLALLDGLVAASVWYLLGGAEAPLSALGILTTIVALVATQLVGSSLVWTVIGLAQQRRPDVGDLRESLAVALPFAGANAAATLSVVAMLTVAPTLAWAPAIPFLVMLVAYRAYGSERRHRDTLGFLYDIARNVHGGADATASLTPMLQELQRHLSAARVELAVGAGGAPRITTFVVTGDGEVLVETSEVGDRSDLTDLSGSVLDPGRRMAAVANLGGHARLVVNVESGVAGADGFDEVGVNLVESVANLAATVVERADLEEMKTAFLSAVSHELRTPLAVVMGTATTLRHRGGQLRADQTQLLTERLEAHAHRLDRLLTDLLDIDRLARGVIEPRRREVDLSLMASRLVDALEVTTHPVKLYGSGVRADIDGPQVERIIENLVRNAVKYTPAGTPIEISLQRLPDRVCILVEDRGPGVPDIAKTSILEPFVRLDADHPSPGTGIGLSLVRRFAQLHGGDIEVRDRPGGGATFSVTLVDDRPDLVAAAAEAAAPSAPVVPLRPPA